MLYTRPRKKGKIFIRIFNTNSKIASVPSTSPPPHLTSIHEKLIRAKHRRVDTIPGHAYPTGNYKVDLLLHPLPPDPDPLTLYFHNKYKEEIECLLKLYS